MTLVYPNLYLGDLENASNLDWLTKKGITHIVNAAEEIRNYFPQNFTYLTLGLKDIPTEHNLQRVLPHAYHFILTALENPKNRVLVHCAAGISRSASVVIYYIMKQRRWSFAQTLRHVKNLRPQVMPNPGFRYILKKYSPMAAPVNVFQVDSTDLRKGLKVR